MSKRRGDLIQVTGHRGARDLAPENTLAAFGLARDLGCEAVELDVQLTRDGELAVIHDDRVDRTTDGTGLVMDHTMGELKRLDAGQGETIPTLGEVFDLLLDTPMRIQIELKGVGTEEPAAAFVKTRELASRVVFTSFHHRRVLRAKELLPEVSTGILITCSPADPKLFLESARADRLHVNYVRIDELLVEQVKALGKQIIAWGRIVETADIDRLIELGVDAIGSDRPDLVIERLRIKGKR